MTSSVGWFLLKMMCLGCSSKRCTVVAFVMSKFEKSNYFLQNVQHLKEFKGRLRNISHKKQNRIIFLITEMFYSWKKKKIFFHKIPFVISLAISQRVTTSPSRLHGNIDKSQQNELDLYVCSLSKWLHWLAVTMTQFSVATWSLGKFL